MQQLHCSVDETGQDTLGSLFIVGTHIDDRDQARLSLIRYTLEKIEQASGKNALKWVRARDDKRAAYIRLVLQEPELAGKMYYAVHHDTKEYLDKTVITTANTITSFAAGDDYKATKTVDGSPNIVINKFAAALRKMHIRTKTDGVRGARDEVDPLLRLADAICGFTRGAEEGRPDFMKLLKRAEADAIIQKL